MLYNNGNSDWSKYLAGEKSAKKMISWIVLYILPTVKQVE